LYKETWEDGISGIPTKSKNNNDNDNDNGTMVATKNSGGDGNDGSILTETRERQLRDAGDNATKNLHLVRKDAQNLLEHAKETTGIRTQDDAKALASEVLKIATECIREFMAGYRKGRDSEIDKMLHEYFQEEDGSNNSGNKSDNTSSSSKDNGVKDENSSDPMVARKQRKKRKPKRGIPRT